MEQELKELTEVIARVEKDLKRRDALIRAASAQGATRRRVAQAAGLSFGRIQQIVAGAALVVLLIVTPASAKAPPSQVQSHVLSAGTTIGLRAAYESDHAAVDVGIYHCPQPKPGLYACPVVVHTRVGTTHATCRALILARTSAWEVGASNCDPDWLPLRQI